MRLACCCLLSGGHLLIEDLPGMGKTTLARALARGLGLDFVRIQFTSDLLPGDITGHPVYDRESGGFEFHRGPIFTQLLLADEINRASPRTQSALLEAMEERQVSAEGESRALPDPFFVIATQNPVDMAGTHPLPESQLDRFLLSLELGYPDRANERRLLLDDQESPELDIQSHLDTDDLKWIRRAATDIHCSDAVLDYVQALVEASREHPSVRMGLSPRATRGLMRAARTLALMDGRDHVLPEDLQCLFPAVCRHRLVLDGAGGGAAGSRSVIAEIMRDTAVLR